jgi:hypothetical protein
MADTKSAQDKVISGKISRLTKYLEHVKSRITASVPDKHKNRPEEYKKWLQLELTRTTRKLESLRG